MDQFCHDFRLDRSEKSTVFAREKSWCTLGIIYKLVPENNKQRKLRYVRNLWNTIIETKPVYDIYSEKLLGLDDFDIDHFVPWSFVANDELWNLLPMDSSLNSSKSNNLPQWKYFELFAKNQYMMYESAKSSRKDNGQI